VNSGERRAARHYRLRGWRVLDANVRVGRNELDLVVRRGRRLVFVEVKERTGSSHGQAIEAVTPLKRHRLVRAARVYAAKNGLLESLLRFDVVAIDWGPEGPRLRHEPGAFSAE